MAAIKRILAPRIRQLGFTGSGGDYRRQCDDAIHTINIQSNRYGGSACVNMGLHFTCLPRTRTKDFPPLSEWREIDCEFRTRLAPVGKSDHWWNYEESEQGSDALVLGIADLYTIRGEQLFSQAGDSSTFASAWSVEWLAGRGNRSTLAFPWHTTDVRIALALARIHRHHGNFGSASALATFALNSIKPPIAEDLVADLQDLANAT